jgi:N6-adenosine-specific RNA methylase IME4
VVSDWPHNIQFKGKKGQNFLPYQTLNDSELYKIPLTKVQKRGFYLHWVVNAKIKQGIAYGESQGYR